MRPLSGVDLGPVIAGGPSGREYVTSTFKDFCWVRDEKYWFWCHYSGQRPVLFDLEADPNCQRNIAEDHKGRVERLYGLALEDADGELPIYDGMRTTFADGSAES